MAAGTWTVVVDPKRSLLLSSTLRVVSVPADAVVASSLGSNPVVTLAPGQNGAVTFPKTAGQRFFIGCTLTTPAKRTRSIPSCFGRMATPVSRPLCLSTYQGKLFDTMTSPTAGTWSLKIDPAVGATSR